MNISASDAINEVIILEKTSNSKLVLSGITENGEKIKLDEETWLPKGQNHRFAALYIPALHFKEGDVSRLKRVLANDARLYISCDIRVPSDRLRIMFDILQRYRDNVVYLTLNIGDGHNQDVLRELIKLNLSCYLWLADCRDNMELRERLNSLINLYESNVKVLRLALQNCRVISSSMPEWKKLKNLIQEKKDTLEGWFEVPKIEADPIWLKSLISSFPRKTHLCVYNVKNMFGFTYDAELGKRSEILFDFDYIFGQIVKPTIEELAIELVKVQSSVSAEETKLWLKDREDVETLLLPAMLKSLEVATNNDRIELKDSEVSLSQCQVGREILALMDSRYATKVKQLIESNKKGSLNRTKLMVVGAGGAGKTSCCRALLGKAFVQEHLSTVVADGSRDLVLLDAKDINISKAWKELPTDEESIYKRDFDAIRRNIVREERNFNQKQVEKKFKDKSVQQRVIKAAQEKKTDYKFKERVTRILRRKEKHQLVSAFDVNEFEKRARGMKLTLWDFGGQAVFDAAHHFYLSNQGIVLLVFNVENWIKNRKGEEQSIKKWLASLMFYSPNSKVLIVGTRAGAVVPEVLEEVSKALDELHLQFDDVEVIENEVDKLFFFPVENSEPDRNKKLIQNLRETIKAVLQDPKAPWKKEVPLSWLFFMHLIDSEDKNVTSLSEVFAFAQAKGFSEEEVKKLLKFFTEAGSIVSFEERFRKVGNRAEMVDDTVLKPKWLLKSLACFLFDDIHVKSKKALYKLGKGMKSKVFLLKNGFLSRDLLHKILKADTSPRKQREAQFLKQLCELMLVMSPVDQITTALMEKVNQKHLIGDDFWLLPSMLNRKSIIGVEDKVSFTHGQSVTVKWNSVTPQGLFERFVGSFCKVAKGKQGLNLLSISSKTALITLRDVKIELRKETLKVFTVSFSPGTQDVNALVNEIIGDVLTQIKDLELAFELGTEVLPSLELVKKAKEPSVLDSSAAALEWDFDCFLSHSWGDYPDFETHNQVLKIATELKNEGLRVWVDASELNATVAGELHRGIDGSACFIAFVTKKYLKSADDRDNNAGKEFNYAALKNGAASIIPVLLDPEFRNPKDWKGNVGIHLGNALYVDFSAAEAQEENMNALCKRIKQLSLRKRQRRKIDE